ncbi:hypothetical protein GCM10023196_079980 [Actinoallomurus vinaceus]|uniref:Transposase n=1 Tax=Actinoallomurus vinaceus TaxID=1080074 RepID=A0ABP8UPZ9_9ACTN
MDHKGGSAVTEKGHRQEIRRAVRSGDPPGRPVRDATSGELAAQVPGGSGEWTLCPRVPGTWASTSAAARSG